MENVIRVVIVDDHQDVRDGLRALVNDQNDMEVSAEASNGQDALECVRVLCPSVVLMDVSMPGWSGLTTTRKVLEVCPDTKIVAVSRYDDASVVQGMLGAGAVGYVLKQNAARELIQAIRVVAAGGHFLDNALQSTLVPGVHAISVQAPEGDADGSLSDTEQRVLRLVADACSNDRLRSPSQSARRRLAASRTRRCERRGWRHGSKSSAMRNGGAG